MEEFVRNLGGRRMGSGEGVWGRRIGSGRVLLQIGRRALGGFWGDWVVKGVPPWFCFDPTGRGFRYHSGVESAWTLRSKASRSGEDPVKSCPGGGGR